MKKFLDYMPYSMEYPDPTQIDMFNSNWLMSYISHSFLNGWINYTKPISAFVINRYREADEFRVKIKEWETTKMHHSNLNFFGDDVLILAKTRLEKYYKYKYIEEYRPSYWFFWFDQDVSDCEIGRFETSDSESDVIESFKHYLTWLGDDGVFKNSYELKTDKLNGWMEF